jgi:trigger factor
VNVSFEKTDELNGLLSIQLSKEDYQDKVNEQLKQYRKSARIPGFRPGTAPLGMVKRMVGQSVLAEEINRLASETLNSYITENKLDILGYPLASKTKSSELDFENEGGDFTLYFDLGLAPEFEIALNKRNKLTRYVVEIDEETLEKELKSIYERYGEAEMIEQALSDNDVLKLILNELDKDGNPFEGGVSDKTVSILPEIIQDKDTKALFEGIKIGDEVKADIFKMFNDNLKVISSHLEMPEEGLNDLEPIFSCKVEEIRHQKPASPGPELYEKIFGENVPEDEAEFRKRIKESMERHYAADSDQLVNNAVDELVLEKHDFQLPDDFLKRWLMETKPEEYTKENIDERFAQEADTLRYQLIREKVAEEQQFEISEEEINNMNLSYTLQMFSQYGMQNPDPQMVESFSQRQAQDPEHMRRIRDLALSRKVTDYFRSIVSLKEKKVNVEEFQKIVQEHNQTHNNR